MYQTFCIFQDILTNEIIGHGTKRGGIYYVDDMSIGKAKQYTRIVIFLTKTNLAIACPIRTSIIQLSDFIFIQLSKEYYIIYYDPLRRLGTFTSFYLIWYLLVCYFY